MGQECFIIHFMASIVQLVPLSFHMCHPILGFHSDVFHLELYEFCKRVNFILSLLRVPPLFFQARCEPPFGRASVFALATIVNDVSFDTIYIKTQVFRLLRYYSPAPRKIARSDWATQNITHNMTSSIKQPYGVHSH